MKPPDDVCDTKRFERGVTQGCQTMITLNLRLGEVNIE